MIRDSLDFIDGISSVYVIMFFMVVYACMVTYMLMRSESRVSRYRENARLRNEQLFDCQVKLMKAQDVAAKLNQHTNALIDEKNELQKRVDGWNHTSKMCGVGELMKVSQWEKCK